MFLLELDYQILEALGSVGTTGLQTEELAKHLGVTWPQVSREMQRLSDYGLLSHEQQEYYIWSLSADGYLELQRAKRCRSTAAGV